MSASLPERLAQRDDADVRELTLRAPKGHVCFAGHFPGQPIVPGVVLLHWAVSELERWQERALAIGALEALKFRRVLLPGETFVLRLSRTAGSGSFAFEMRDPSGPIGSGRIRLRV